MATSLSKTAFFAGLYNIILWSWMCEFLLYKLAQETLPDKNIGRDDAFDFNLRLQCNTLDCTVALQLLGICTLSEAEHWDQYLSNSRVDLFHYSFLWEIKVLLEKWASSVLLVLLVQQADWGLEISLQSLLYSGEHFPTGPAQQYISPVL